MATIGCANTCCYQPSRQVPPWRTADPCLVGRRFGAAILTIRKAGGNQQGLRIRETKGGKIRRLNLPNSTVVLLQNLRTRQAETRRMFGFDYHTDLDLAAITCIRIRYIRPSTVTKAYARRIASRSRRVSLHDERSHGSQLLGLGVPLPTVSKRLGHRTFRHFSRYLARASAGQNSDAEIWGWGPSGYKDVPGAAHSGYHYISTTM